MTFSLEISTSLHFSIEIFAPPWIFLWHWNLYFLMTFSLEISTSLHFSIEIFTFFPTTLKSLLSHDIFSWNLYFSSLFYWNLCFLFNFSITLKSLLSHDFFSWILYFSSLFHWNLYILCIFLPHWSLYFPMTFSLEISTSLHFSIEIFAFFLIFLSHWNLYFLMTFSLEISTSLHFSFEIFTFFPTTLKSLLSHDIFSWNLYFSSLFKSLYFLLAFLWNWSLYFLMTFSFEISTSLHLLSFYLPILLKCLLSLNFFYWNLCFSPLFKSLYTFFLLSYEIGIPTFSWLFFLYFSSLFYSNLYFPKQRVHTMGFLRYSDEQVLCGILTTWSGFLGVGSTLVEFAWNWHHQRWASLPAVIFVVKGQDLRKKTWASATANCSPKESWIISRGSARAPTSTQNGSQIDARARAGTSPMAVTKDNSTVSKQTSLAIC